MDIKELHEYVYNTFKSKNIQCSSLPTEFDIESYYKLGALKRSELIHGNYYIGKCRNSVVGKWNSKTGKMRYTRCKFGHWFEEDINYFDNDNGLDLFISIGEIDISDVPNEKIIKQF